MDGKGARTGLFASEPLENAIAHALVCTELISSIGIVENEEVPSPKTFSNLCDRENVGQEVLLDHPWSGAALRERIDATNVASVVVDDEPRAADIACVWVFAIESREVDGGGVHRECPVPFALRFTEARAVPDLVVVILVWNDLVVVVRAVRRRELECGHKGDQASREADHGARKVRFQKALSVCVRSAVEQKQLSSTVQGD